MKRWAIILLIVASIGGIAVAVWYFGKGRWIGMIKAKYGKANPAVLHWTKDEWAKYSLADLQELYRTGGSLLKPDNRSLT